MMTAKLRWKRMALRMMRTIKVELFKIPEWNDETTRQQRHHRQTDRHPDKRCKEPNTMAVVTSKYLKFTSHLLLIYQIKSNYVGSSILHGGGKSKTHKIASDIHRMSEYKEVEW